ncbi:retinol dehydrogenase 12-like [Amyelois transitella]|uniref:retinol dehydrogenase 12-like n=1 Tax=Amyelois transitella TaxID=680683 RepID=UPI00067A9B72|nr:retinol dehydrogenase 12-like [Amyelois transitella]
MTVLVIIYCFILLILILAVYQKNTNVICKSKRRLDGKTAIVTGGNSGMGLEIAKDLALRGARVIVACPFEDEGNAAQELIIQYSGNQNVQFEYLDLSSFASVRKFATKVIEQETKLHILVNNAGVAAGNMSTDGNNYVMQVNYLGTVLLTLLLLPLLEKSGDQEEQSRIINTASLTHKIGRVNLEGWKQSGLSILHYANSKLCIMLFTYELGKRLKSSRVIVNAVDPGFVGTQIYKNGTNIIIGPPLTFLIALLSKNPFEGSQTAIHAAVCESARKQNGQYFINCKVTNTAESSWYRDDKTTELLWNKTMDVIKFE